CVDAGVAWGVCGEKHAAGADAGMLPVGKLHRLSCGAPRTRPGAKLGARPGGRVGLPGAGMAVLAPDLVVRGGEDGPFGALYKPLLPAMTRKSPGVVHVVHLGLVSSVQPSFSKNPR